MDKHTTTVGQKLKKRLDYFPPWHEDVGGPTVGVAPALWDPFFYICQTFFVGFDLQFIWGDSCVSVRRFLIFGDFVELLFPYDAEDRPGFGLAVR